MFTGTALNHFRVLGPSGLRVSPLCLGTMTFGEDWGWGSSKDASRRVLDLYTEKGGNFLDTANIYTNGTSETFLGDFLQGRRDNYVLATKYTLATRPGDPNAAGNHSKNLHQALEASLKRLKTDYVDLYWVHAWDGITPIESTMRALDDAVRAGKVLHVGVSDFPAWTVSAANTLAQLRGWSPFTALQIEYSLIERTVERDLIPMAEHFGLAVCPWSPLAGGVLTGKYNKSAAPPKDTRFANESDFSRKNLADRNKAVAEEVAKVAAQVNRSAAQVALAWLLHQDVVNIPIIGGRNEQQIADNLGAIDLRLTHDQMAHLNRASDIELGFPHHFLKMDSVRNLVTAGAKIISE